MCLWYELSFMRDNEGEWGDKIVFVLDVSQSMNVVDMDWESRLNSAKDVLYKVLNEYHWYQFALTIFAWDSQRVLPFTHDISLIATFIVGLDSRNITAQGTRIDYAISESLESFYNEEKGGHIIILSDGPEDPYDLPPDTIQSIKDNKHTISIIWIGTEEWWLIPTGDFFEPYKVFNGKRVVSKLNSNNLIDLAQSIDAEYYEYPDIPNIEATVQKSSSRWEYNWFLYISVILWFWFLGTLFSNFFRKNM